jgi:glucan phosphoethanolaminetransferase (alkaline phosphatase superfamily)
MKIFLKIIGQTIVFGIVILLGILLSWEQIPGNKNICDAGQGFYGLAWLIFIIISIALFINSWIFLKKRSWKKYRITVMIICILIVLISLSIRSVIFQVSYGKEKHKIENTENYNQLIEIKLYENGKFYSWTYDMSCQIENIGTYKLNENKITLEFENENAKSEYLGTEYLIENDKVICEKDCEYENELKIK